MALTPGTRLGPYEILSDLGAGGMGEVYRARDTKLNRDVAIKVLLPVVANDPDRLARFSREAQMLASLNHPNIGAIYGLEDGGEVRALVMELVEGPTLADRIARGPLPIDEALPIAKQIADALEAAHEQGIIHRDLKPANIKVRNDGTVKVLDFGLAKAMDPTGAASANAMNSPTLTAATVRGVILGTPAYMSPEQAAGKAVDKRSDLWAFGVVLLEMLTGRQVFKGDTVSHVLAAVLKDEPDWTALATNTPAPIRKLLRRCLEKDRKRRLDSAADARLEVEDALMTPTDAGETRRVNVRPLAFALVGSALVLLGGLLLWWFQRPVVRAPRQVVQFDISAPPGTIFAPPIGRQPFAISPDGKRLAFIATGANGTNIWARDLASPEMHAVPGTEGALSIFWAPDSHSVFYAVRNTLKQANLETGSGRSVAELPSFPRLGTWRSNGDLLLYAIGPSGTYELRLADGSLKKGAVFDDLAWPQFFPGVDRFVYVVRDKALQQSHAVVADYVSRKQVPLMQTDSLVYYAPPLSPAESGYLLFIRGASLLAQPFDADHVKLAGEPFPIAQNVAYYGSNLTACFSVSANGVLVYQANYPVSELNWYDRSGNVVGQAGRPSTHWGQVRASRDGQRVAATVWSPENGVTSIWIFDSKGKESRRLTFPPEIDRRPVWSPEGTRLASGRSSLVGASQLAILNADGNGAAEEFVNLSPREPLPAALPTDWSWDGRFITLDDGVGEEHHTVWIGDVASHTVAPFLKNDFAQWGTAFSRDGKRIAFVSLESGRPEVYVQAFESTPTPHVVGGRRQVSKDGAWLVRWRTDDRELFYVGMDNSLVAVTVAGPLEFGEPQPLFRIPGALQYNTTRDFQFDVSPDGQRFIMSTTGSVPPPPFTVIENWQDKFRR